MDMNDLKYQLELAAFAEKIALAELEEKKASERVFELKYELARFRLQCLGFTAKEMEKNNERPGPVPA